MDLLDDEEPVSEEEKPKKKAATKKRKSDEMDEDHATPQKAKGRQKKATPSKPSSAKKAKNEKTPPVEDPDVQKILADIHSCGHPLRRKRDSEKKFNYKTFKSNQNAIPTSASSAELPVGKKIALLG